MELRVANKLSYVLQSCFAEATASHSPHSSPTNVKTLRNCVLTTGTIVLLPHSFNAANGPLRSRCSSGASMYTSPALSKYIFDGIVVALLAIGTFGGLLYVLYGEQYPLHHPQAVIEPVSSTRLVDRSHKSDRLPLMLADPTANTSSIPKNTGAPEHTVRGVSSAPAWPTTLGTVDGKRAPTVAPALLLDCETVASPFSSPILGRIIRTCFV